MHTDIGGTDEVWADAESRRLYPLDQRHQRGSNKRFSSSQLLLPTPYIPLLGEKLKINRTRSCPAMSRHTNIRDLRLAGQGGRFW